MIADMVMLHTDHIGALVIASGTLGAVIGIWITNREEKIRIEAKKQAWLEANPYPVDRFADEEVLLINEIQDELQVKFAWALYPTYGLCLKTKALREILNTIQTNNKGER